MSLSDCYIFCFHDTAFSVLPYFAIKTELCQLEGKYSLESTDPRESEIRAPPLPLPYLMPIPPTRFYITNSTY